MSLKAHPLPMPAVLTNYAVAPGEYLSEWIEEAGLTPKVVAEMMGLSNDSVTSILDGRIAISHEISIQLERVVGIPEQAWLRFETRYREAVARLHVPDDAVLVGVVMDVDPREVGVDREIVEKDGGNPGSEESPREPAHMQVGLT